MHNSRVWSVKGSIAMLCMVLSYFPTFHIFFTFSISIDSIYLVLLASKTYFHDNSLKTISKHIKSNKNNSKYKENMYTLGAYRALPLGT